MKGVRVGILAGESQDVIHDVGPRSGLVSYAYFFSARQKRIHSFLMGRSFN